MEIFIESTGETKQIEFSGKIIDLLKKLKINAEETVIIKNNKLVTEFEKISDNDSLKLLSVVSGG